MTVFSLPSFFLFGVSRNRSPVFKLMKSTTHRLLFSYSISFLITLFIKLTYLDTIRCELNADCGNNKQINRCSPSD